MFEPVEVDAEDATACAEALVASLVEQRLAAASRFALVARWADLHELRTLERQQGPGVPVRHRTAWRVERDDIPAVTVVGVAELGLLLHTSTRSAEFLLRDVLEIRHRLPVTWQAVMTGQVDDWKARAVAKATRHLSEQRAGWVDREIQEALVGLPWGRALAVVEGKVVAADPVAHEARLTEEEARKFVSTRRRSNVHGLRTMVARLAAGDIARLEAMVGHLAGLIAAAGDEQPADTRRANALALLANPALACVYLANLAPAQAAQQCLQADGPAGPHAEPSDDEPSDDQASAQPSAVELGREFGRMLTELGSKAIDKLRPSSVLHIHISSAAVEGRPFEQVARVEDPVAGGAIGIEQLREWLKNDRVVVKPVVDPLEAAPVDQYEVFPYGTRPARHADLDHTVPYATADEGGPPGQTAIGNLGPLGRGHHLLKTFDGFTVHQPVAGLYYWCTPNGWWYQVDHRGTRPLGRHKPAALQLPAGDRGHTPLTPMEQRYRRDIIVELAA